VERDLIEEKIERNVKEVLSSDTHRDKAVRCDDNAASGKVVPMNGFDDIIGGAIFIGQDTGNEGAVRDSPQF